MTAKANVLFLCMGHSGRSQMAEAFLPLAAARPARSAP